MNSIGNQNHSCFHAQNEWCNERVYSGAFLLFFFCFCSSFILSRTFYPISDGSELLNTSFSIWSKLIKKRHYSICSTTDTASFPIAPYAGVNSECISCRCPCWYRWLVLFSYICFLFFPHAKAKRSLVHIAWRWAHIVISFLKEPLKLLKFLSIASIHKMPQWNVTGKKF